MRSTYGVRSAEARLQDHSPLIDLFGISIDILGALKCGDGALGFFAFDKAGEVDKRVDGLAPKGFSLGFYPVISLLGGERPLIGVNGLLEQGDARIVAAGI